MGVHLVPLLAALVQERQLEERPHVGPFAGQRDEERHVRRIVLHALPVGVKIDRPRVPADDERIRRHVLPDPHPFQQRIPRDLEVMRAVHGLRYRRRRRGRRRRRRRRRGTRKSGPRIEAFSENLSHPRATRIGSKIR